jgi:NAD-reducing hydrogenase small subunit
MSLLDIDEDLEAIAKKIEIVYGPLVDSQRFPEGVDVTLVEGAVSSQDDLEKAQLIRQRSKLVISLGDCAVTSNIPGMRNPIPVQKILERVYVEGAQHSPGIPAEGVPKLLKRALPVQEVIRVDFHVPGCPPPPGTISYVLAELLEGRTPDLGAKVKFG